MRTRTIDSLDTLEPAAWNALLDEQGTPFLRHEFLAALERHGCVGDHWGWLPRHVTAWSGDRLIGALPFYLKYNSYGELVFDWSWAEAYRRAGLRYYPKGVTGIPYTPVTGPRLLVHPEADAAVVRRTLLEAVSEMARAEGLSSLHWLFTTEEESRALGDSGLMIRHDCQYHWFNRGYRDFDDLLDTFTAEKRKKVRRERRRVTEAGIEMEVLHGKEISPEQWRLFHEFYTDTFDRRGGYPTLTLPFFESTGKALGDSVVLVLAREQGRYVAGALSFRSDDALFGRHWGCVAERHSLHFEACYYTGIEYCIRHGLTRFEPGAQGEHKVSRGFEPVITRSAHHLEEAGFRPAVDDFVTRERRAVAAHVAAMREHLPFRQPADEPPPQAVVGER